MRTDGSAHACWSEQVTPTIHRIVSGRWRENGYVVESANSSALIIDPGMNTGSFKSLIEQRACRPCAILNTHAHYDHIGSVSALMEAYEIPFYLHKGDAALLRQANIYRALFEETETLRIPSKFLDLSEINGWLEIGGFDIEILVMPGHTTGSTCFRIGDLLFTGDTLLGKGPGRTDLPGGSATDMRASQARLATLPGHLIVHPGHGEIMPMSQIRERIKAE
jgi:hydroxyacylglutathione hydrolase